MPNPRQTTRGAWLDCRNARQVIQNFTFSGYCGRVRVGQSRESCPLVEGLGYLIEGGEWPIPLWECHEDGFLVGMAGWPRAAPRLRWRGLRGPLRPPLRNCWSTPSRPELTGIQPVRSFAFGSIFGTLSQQGKTQNSFVYSVNNIGLAPFNFQGYAWNNSTELTTSWTSFDFSDPANSTPAGDGAVKVQVNMVIPATPFQTPARILPTAMNIAASQVTQVGNSYSVNFTITRARSILRGVL